MRRGGKRRSGYSERYDATARASMKVIFCPVAARDVARRINVCVKTLVGLARQVRTVKGLKRYLFGKQSVSRVLCKFRFFEVAPYPAAIVVLLRRNSFRGEVKRREETDTPVSAIFISASAPTRSATTYNKFVANGYL